MPCTGRQECSEMTSSDDHRGDRCSQKRVLIQRLHREEIVQLCARSPPGAQAGAQAGARSLITVSR